MLIQRYKNLEYEQLQKLEKELSNKIGLKQLTRPDPIKNRTQKKYSTPAENLNHYWTKNAFWVPTEKNWIDISIRSNDYPGEYQIPLHVSINEDFREYIDSGNYGKGLKKIHISHKPTLKKEKLNLGRQIRDIQRDFDKELQKLIDPLVDHIHHNSVEVKEYNPFGRGKEARKTQTMIGLIDNVETAYRGIERGSKFAYERLIGEYVSPAIFNPYRQEGKHPGEAMIDHLYGYTARLVELSKDYLVYQMAVAHFKQKGKNTITSNETEYIQELLGRLKSVENKHHAVVDFFKSEIDGFSWMANDKKFIHDGSKSGRAISLALVQVYRGL